MLRLKTKTTIDWGDSETPKSELVEIRKTFLGIPYSIIYSEVDHQNRPDDSKSVATVGFN